MTKEHRHKKSLGQNFLSDPFILESIVQALDLNKADVILEVGPGEGALTQHLLQEVQQLTAVELDDRLIPKLQHRFGRLKNFCLIHQDILKIDLQQLCKSPERTIRIVGNLPYNISTPLLIALCDVSTQLQDVTIMIQKEVAQRIVALPNCKAYGRLTLMIQAYFDATCLIDVPPSAFTPPPKVDSQVIRLTPKQEPLLKACQQKTFEQLIRMAFATRRKTIANNLKKIISKEALTSLGITPSARPENLTLVQYVDLANKITL